MLSVPSSGFILFRNIFSIKIENSVMGLYDDTPLTDFLGLEVKMSNPFLHWVVLYSKYRIIDLR